MPKGPAGMEPQSPRRPAARGGQPLNSDHLAPTGKTLPTPAFPKPLERQSFDLSIQKQDDKIDESICKGC
jgi:hypothetical protein